ncbi:MULTISPECIES: serine/threonine-protein kinase [Mycobacteroides]|uniref:serine/threonine-protein kinase n=1 Tax=Mycobacteroides TaxID=670516 RepID=UPI0009EA337A|nr:MULTISPECIES: serine/threonine-protein kinase [Mycobacteroides]
MVLENGTAFEGYAVQSLLGSGGMGDVYLVRNTRLDRLEALKVLRMQISEDEDYRDRFMREIKLAAKLRHPNIVQVHHSGDHDGQLWMSMDYIDGADCTELLKERGSDGLAPIEVLQIVSAIADALDYSHGQSLLHRDVKPANILVTTDARTGRKSMFLADFGIARPLDDLLSSLTATNMVLGTVGYAAPEQITGQTLDGRADQYALAATAFQLFTGSAIMSSPSLPMLIQRVRTPAPKLSDVKPELVAYDAAMAKALSIDPADRFSTCRQFADALAGNTDTQLRSGYAPTDMNHTQLNPANQRAYGPLPTQIRPLAQPLVSSQGRSAPAQSGSHTALIAAIIGGALILGCLVVGAAWLMRQSDAGQTSQAVESTPTAPMVTDVVSVMPTPSQAPYRSSSRPPEAPTMVLPDADTRGFTGYNGLARCVSGARAEFILRTTESAVVICRSASGSLSYRGLRLSDNATLTLSNVKVATDGWLVTNTTEATYYYLVNSAGLQIFKESNLIGDEPAVESATPN